MYYDFINLQAFAKIFKISNIVIECVGFTNISHEHKDFGNIIMDFKDLIWFDKILKILKHLLLFQRSCISFKDF